ncbi:TetR/AcrR family transcriptional regulator [Acidocella aminolytica]|uniref:Transcriptional regulator TetR n=1 Tax=Acidocella aminolytica 101 = DSM 11237 TaxID=1120923 RepID=A0A0D6PK99_9PROT|nr:TetR/AcrR family transcriptional regulator [Acidocella aminolytica]GAN81856.1 transcriptional regulator TetR [Acidocella aminolytica 101 = DSM 11237]GBQ42878.1 TetR family transcriptional regulator [Acidocella aminolytica 101 = DSM 11237]SHE30434.1 transcriptional regulator, TetR family [Acidocella aminolytica 101 = DSM 11237]
MAAKLKQAAQPIPSTAPGELSARHLDVLDAAAALFAARGYHATSVRDIGERVGLLGGSLYHYIKSKENLFATVHDRALAKAAARINAAVAPLTDPWERLRVASITLAEIQLDQFSATTPLMNDFRLLPPGLQERLIETRDRFEALFDGLVQDVPLPPDVNRKIYRLALLTLLNNLSSWYRPGKMTPAQIGDEVMKIFASCRLLEA